MISTLPLLQPPPLSPLPTTAAGADAAAGKGRQGKGKGKGKGGKGGKTEDIGEDLGLAKRLGITSVIRTNYKETDP